MALEYINRQAETVIAKFNGPTVLAHALRSIGHPRSIGVIYKWMWPKHRHGTGGFIPPKMIAHVREAARLYGINLTDADLSTAHRYPYRERRP